MSFCVKLSLAKKLSEVLKSNIGPSSVEKIVKNLRLSLQPRGDTIDFLLPCKSVPGIENIGNISGTHKAHISNDNIILPVDKTEFVSQVLLSNNVKADYKALHSSPEKIIVEFSSPNIAKPFHVGHFRGTVLGNFVANLTEYFASDVVRLNYIGDWGTPFGLIQIGLKELNVERQDLEQKPLDTLYKAYVKANAMANTNPELHKQASDIFQQLEQGADPMHIQDWVAFRKVTVEALRSTYERLGIEFDEYNWESDYAAGKIPSILQDLQSMPEAVNEGGHLSLPVGDRRITLLKSNGSTMYVTRDVAAAVDRQERYQPSRMLYVTDFSQENHFKDLVHILARLGHAWSDTIQHVKYGKVQGMSTREGQGVFLQDLLDEARDRMVEKQREASTTRVALDDRRVSDVLGITALIVYQLKMRRGKSCSFSWEECLQMSGDGGVRLQYTHCRMVSLLQGCGTTLPDTCDPSAIQEPVAQQLVLEIARFDDVLCLAYEAYEPSVLVKYLFHLSNKINKALKELPVKGSEPHVAQQRLLLFNRARLVLSEALQVLGVQPLDSM